MFRILIAAGILCACLAAPASAETAGDRAGSPVASHSGRFEVAQAQPAKKARRAQRNQVIIEQERLRIPTPTIALSAGGLGTTYSDRVVGCTHGAGVAGLSGMDRGPAIHNCAFGR